MPQDDDLPIFRPKFGKAPGAASATAIPRFRNAVLRRSGGSGGGSRRPLSASRRVVVKAHIAKLGRGGAKAAALHIRYIERDGVEKDGSKGHLYGPDGQVSASDFESPRFGEKHQIRLIVSPEDGDKLDLTDYVRKFMARVEEDTNRRLEWAAVNHFDTGHPHAHIVIRGVDLDGLQVRFERAYISNQLRERAQELATEELGPRPEYDIARQRQREVTEDRFTSLDRELDKRAVEGRVQVRLGPAQKGERESLLIARLEHLADLRLAERTSSTSWNLAPGWREHLRELGKRGDIIAEMHRALRADPARYRIIQSGQSLGEEGAGASPVIHARVVSKGLSDELRGAFYAVLETPTGHGYYLPLDQRAAEQLREGDLVGVSTKPQKWQRAEDQEIDRVARGNGGVYDAQIAANRATSHAKQLSSTHSIDRHSSLTHNTNTMSDNDSKAKILETHAKRLHELEKLGLAQRIAEGRWQLGPQLLETLAAKDRAEPRHRLLIERAPLRVDEQVRHPGAVWLDKVDLESAAPYGFGAEVRRAAAAREQVLRQHGIDPTDPRRHATLRELDRRNLGRRIAAESGAQFLENPPLAFRGQIRLRERSPSGVAYAEITDGKRFVVVAVNHDLKKQAGKTVTLLRDTKGRIQVRASERDRSTS